MVSKRRDAAATGDVFLIPIEDGVDAVAQVLDRKQRLCLIVSFQLLKRSPQVDVDQALLSGIELAGVVFDAKLANGDWPVIDHRDSRSHAMLLFASGHEERGTLTVRNFDSSVLRAATETEAAAHERLHLSYPMVFQKAVAAAAGVGPWREAYDHFRHYAGELSQQQ